MLNDLLEFANKLSEGTDTFRKARDEDRQRIAIYLGKIETCLKTCVEDLKSGAVSGSGWAELQVYAQNLPRNIGKELGKDKANELADLLNKTANYKPEISDINSIEAAAGNLRGLAARVLAEPSSNWLQQFVHAKLPLWTIVPLLLLAGYPLILTYVKPSTVSQEPQVTSLLLPANKLWLNTGIQIKPNQTVKITATGSVNLGIHRLVEAAYTHSYPRWNWTDPAGESGPSSSTPIDKGLKALFIAPGLKPCVLLAYVDVTGKNDLGKYNPKPQGIEEIGRGKEITSKEGGTLWLVINDAVLDDSDKSRDAYVLPQDKLDETYGKGKVTEEKRQEEWERIKTDDYFDAFFDDNAGEFLVQVQVVQ
ncbi:MAG: hypothetical protein KA717_06075 [Woronichinia naegeliana WA131]|jgi:hypothetical protein|uniref:Uncharacterized protein n=1 Tax=Woronichinia naegeliana WA131 TaxID=2824559 RepID=A0A977L0X7_9CYAN|nr:MAG: hypothetical protein KA717_06075 [Woronichinia naegeliana WA131]